jgi:hypothetical protein
MCLHVGKSAFRIPFSDRARRSNTFAHLNAAADLIYEHGVDRTSLDEVMAASGVSKSQRYPYFAEKNALVLEVIARQPSASSMPSGRTKPRHDQPGSRTNLDSFSAPRPARTNARE